jgi:GNAT superfamily N-acetyltransferase
MIFKATIEDVRPITEVMQIFRDCTKIILVDVETCVNTYANLINSGRGAMFGYKIEDKIVGGLGCIKGDDLHYSRTIAIETFWFVLPEARKFGIGIELLNTFESWAKEEKCNYTAMIHLSDSYPEILENLYIQRGYNLAEKHYLRKV